MKYVRVVAFALCLAANPDVAALLQNTPEPQDNVGYRKVNDVDNQISALRQQIAALGGDS